MEGIKSWLVQLRRIQYQVLVLSLLVHATAAETLNFEDFLSELPLTHTGFNVDSGATLFTGTIPSRIGLYSDLTEIEIPNNGLRGPIPSEIGKLEKLTNLHLDGNAFTGTIPVEVMNMPQLETFRFNINELNGTIDSQNIANLVGLKYLGLQGNNLKGTIPTEIGNMNNLGTIQLEQNDFTGSLPTQFGNLNSLTTLFAHENRLNGTLFSEIGRLSELKNLKLDKNQLSGELPIELNSLSRLTSVTLSKNDFNMNCDRELLSWYPEFSQKVKDRYDFSLQCAGIVYPFQMSDSSIGVLEPGSSINTDVKVDVVSARKATFHWSHPEFDELPSFVFIPCTGCGTLVTDFFDCIGFEDVETRGSLVHKYENVGFEITLLRRSEGDAALSNIESRRCIKLDDLEAGDENFNFTYTLDSMLPATEYDAIIRAFHIQQNGTKYEFIFGPSSGSIALKTNDDVPNVSPINLRSEFARDDQIELTWDDTEALVSNGEIIGYEILRLNDAQTFPADKRQITIAGLEPDENYVFQVRARTSAGFSDVYSEPFSTRSCPRDMKRDISGENCFAVQGSFAVSATEALVCEVEIPDVVAGCETEEQLTVQTLDILPGFWRPNVNAFKEIQSCPVPAFCSKQRNTESSSARILMNINTTTDIEPESKQCSSFHRGVYCSACDDGYALSGNSGCIECTDAVRENHQRNYILFVAIISFIILCCVLYVLVKVPSLSCCLCSSKESSSWHKACLNCCKVGLFNIWKRTKVKLRILEGFFQVMFAFQSVLYTDAATSFFSEVIVAVANLNPKVLANGFEVDCAIDLNHYLNLLLYTVPPLVLALLLFILYRLVFVKFLNTSKEKKDKLLKKCFNIFFVVSFLIYPGVSKVIFDTFFCEDFETVEEDSEFIFQSALRADYRLSCSENADGRIGWLIYAVIMVLIFPIGIMGVYTYFLLKYRQTLSDPDVGENVVINWMLACCKLQGAVDEKDQIEGLVSDLIHPYKHNRYWFEAYELVRKLLQTAFVSFCLLFGTQVAASVALNLSVGALLALVRLDPYENPTNFYFAIVSLLALIFATQLTVWLDTEDCDRDCRIQETGDAIGWIVIFEFLAALMFIGLDMWAHDSDGAPREKKKIEARVKDGTGEHSI